MNELLFNEACKSILNNAIERDGVIGDSSQIGTLKEKTVHAVVKNYIEPDPSFHEIKVESFYADIVNEKGIIEIQTSNFNQLRKKLSIVLNVATLLTKQYAQFVLQEILKLFALLKSLKMLMLWKKLKTLMEFIMFYTEQLIR